MWQRYLMWGADWTKLRIDHLRWHLLAQIGFFSPLIIAFEIVPTVNASHIKGLYRTGGPGDPVAISKKALTSGWPRICEHLFAYEGIL